MTAQSNNYREVLVKPQPMPVPGRELVKEIIRQQFSDLYPEVVEDCVYKMEASEAKYGSPLMTNNGRVASLDAYTDLLDTINYLIQEYTEEMDINDKATLRMEISKLNRVAGSIRYRLESEGVLKREYR